MSKIRVAVVGAGPAGLLVYEQLTAAAFDIVLLEAGDVVPADGRIESSATLELQEAALTGESAPVRTPPGSSRDRTARRPSCVARP